jgi:3-oxoacyl-[acyl-carrier protein] reductase
MTVANVMVTGAGSGIGAGIVRELIGRGDSVMALDTRMDRLESLQGEIKSERLYVVQGDVGSEDDVERAVGLTLETFATIDVLCSNAGILDDYAPAGDTSVELWDRVLRVNLTGMFLMARAVLPAMIAAGKGAIVNTASISSFIAGGGGAAYTAAKHGVLGLTRQLAFDYGRMGIRVNAVCPGPVRTGLTEHLFTEEGRQPHVDEVIAATPAGRWAEPAEIAQVVAFLASDAASFVHGSAYVVDGGWIVS